MPNMTQGENYEEDTTEYVEDFESDTDESDEDIESTEITTIFGIPKQYVYIGAIAVVLLIVVVAMFKKKSNDEDEYIAYDDTYVEEYVEDTTTDYEDQEVDPSVVVYYDEEGNGYNTAGELIEQRPPTVDEAFDNEQILELRKLGYTGDEIDMAVKYDFDYDALVAKAQQLRDNESVESLKRMSDSASEEFRYIVSNTYFSQPYLPFTSIPDADEAYNTTETGSYTVNADYVKCPEYGVQLYLKCKVAKDTYVWYCVTPQKWDSIPFSGNIILTVNWAIYAGNYYVTAVTESTTVTTVNALDSDGDFAIMANGSNKKSVIEEQIESATEAGYQQALDDVESVMNEDEEATEE